MNNFYIRGSKHNWMQVLEALRDRGFVNRFHEGGDNPEYLYYNDEDGNIVSCYDRSETAKVIVRSFTELTINNLVCNDAVMVSNTGKTWKLGYYKEFKSASIDKTGVPNVYRYIVAVRDFDFDNPESNVNISI